MHCGSAQVDITPAVGAPLNGFIARYQPSNGVDIPLAARVAVLRHQAVAAAIVSLDTLGLANETAEDLASAVAAIIGAPADHVVIACSHTHSGPVAAPLRGIGPADVDYLRRLKSQLQDAARRATAALEHVAVRYVTAPVHLGMNRRQFIPGQGVVLGSNPDAPTDRATRVLLFEGATSKTILFEHACHPYCLGPQHLLISPDFWGHAATELATHSFNCVHLNGCSGDIRPLRAFEGPVAAKEEGQRLARGILASLPHAKTLDTPTLTVASERLAIPCQPLPPLTELQSQIDAADRTVRAEDRVDPVVRQRVKTAFSLWLDDLRAITARGPLPSVPARVTAIKIGPVAVVTLPGEIFFETSQAITARLDTPMAMTAAYCHAYVGYVCPPQVYDQGGYEPDESHRFVGWWKLSLDATTLLERSAVECWKHAGGSVR
ncbi:MAG: hypothetical protein IT441_08655 [Phycisphaeraceae bacterium]|nr:hypothetical protein [Phycisphaeraceae bacterium]